MAHKIHMNRIDSFELESIDGKIELHEEFTFHVNDDLFKIKIVGDNTRIFKQLKLIEGIPKYKEVKKDNGWLWTTTGLLVPTISSGSYKEEDKYNEDRVAKVHDKSTCTKSDCKICNP